MGEKKSGKFEKNKNINKRKDLKRKKLCYLLWSVVVDEWLLVGVLMMTRALDETWPISLVTVHV